MNIVQVLISTLAQSKVTSNVIERKVKEAAKTQEIIAKTRTGYIPIAFRASQLFFCIADLGTVDPMYQVIFPKYCFLRGLQYRAGKVHFVELPLKSNTAEVVAGKM